MGRESLRRAFGAPRHGSGLNYASPATADRRRRQRARQIKAPLCVAAFAALVIAFAGSWILAHAQLTPTAAYGPLVGAAAACAIYGFVGGGAIHRMTARASHGDDPGPPRTVILHALAMFGSASALAALSSACLNLAVWNALGVRRGSPWTLFLGLAVPAVEALPAYIAVALVLAALARMQAAEMQVAALARAEAASITLDQWDALHAHGLAPERIAALLRAGATAEQILAADDADIAAPLADGML